jgi:aldehyde dehydrogenase (NAD+)
VRGKFIAPTLLDNPAADAKVMQEEIFGPLLPILPFRDLDDVIRQVNERPKPLALYVWSRNDANVEKVIEQTSSGGACVNHNVVQFGHGNLPFGGVNNSGLGNAHGWYGFRSFSHERAIVRGRLMLVRSMFPPYTASVRRMIRWTIASFKWM